MGLARLNPWLCLTLQEEYEDAEDEYEEEYEDGEGSWGGRAGGGGVGLPPTLH